MKLDLITKKQDEFYTPECAIVPILEYINRDWKIWCPFDTDESNFVKILINNGNEVINTHIFNNQDFFNIDIDCDLIISNPPYSLKTEVFDRLFSFKRRFAMLVGVVGLFESKKRFELFANNVFEIMYFDKRISYFKDYNEQKPSLNPPFSSVYLCHNLLPKQIIFGKLKK